MALTNWENGKQVVDTAGDTLTTLMGLLKENIIGNPETNQELFSRIASVQVIFDLGSDVNGFSSQPFLNRESFPHLTTLHTVDRDAEQILLQVPPCISHTHHKQEIAPFILTTTDEADVTLLFNVPQTGINTSEEYQALAQHHTDLGLIIEAGFYSLDKTQMNEAGFELIWSFPNFCKIWRRRSQPTITPLPTRASV